MHRERCNLLDGDAMRKCRMCSRQICCIQPLQSKLAAERKSFRLHFSPVESVSSAEWRNQPHVPAGFSPGQKPMAKGCPCSSYFAVISRLIVDLSRHLH